MLVGFGSMLLKKFAAGVLGAVAQGRLRSDALQGPQDPALIAIVIAVE
jgi:hypothetical protein